MNTFSTPYENVLSLLGTSEAWKKYFPTLNPRGLQVEDIQPAYKETGSSKTPEFKGIDFSTGKTVDLGKFWGDQDLDVSSFWNPKSDEPSSNQINPPVYSTDPLNVKDIENIIRFQQEQARKTRAEETFYNALMLPYYQKAVTDASLLGRQADLQNTLTARTVYDALPTAAGERSLKSQQARGLAAGTFATELGAVSDAASRARRDVAAAIAAGKGFGRA